jgi:hypothetical protein
MIIMNLFLKICDYCHNSIIFLLVRTKSDRKVTYVIITGLNAFG